MTEEVASFPLDEVEPEDYETPQDIAANGIVPEPPRRRGRPPKIKPAEPETTTRVTPEFDKWREPCPKDSPEEAWHWILSNMGKMLWEPHHIGITVIRLTNGMASQPEHLHPKIRGDQVLGDPSAGFAAGDALREWLIEFYHKSPGLPSSYRVQFTTPDNLQIVMTAPFRLDSWVTIDARRRAIDEASRPSGSPVPLGAPWSRRAPGFQPTAAPVAGDGAMHEELGYLRRVAEESRRAAAEGRPPVPVAPPPTVAAPPPPPPSKEEEEARIAKAVATALAAAGIRPKTEQEVLLEMIRQNNEMPLKSIEARLGAAGTPAPASTEAQTTPQDRVEAAGAAVKSLFSEYEALEKSKEHFKKMLGIEDPKTEIVPTEPEQDEEPWYVKLGKSFASGIAKDPAAAVQSAVAFATPFIGGSPLGDMIVKGAAGAAEAARARKIMDSVTMPSSGPTRKPPSV
jgi:hypothetical protein